MRTVLPFVLAALFLVGCGQKSDEEQVDAALQEHPFFKALGVIPAKQVQQPDQGGLDGDTAIPIAAWRVVMEPEISYEINVERPYADVDIDLVWPCTLFVVYTDVPDTSIRDTVLKPAPEVKGSMSARFEFDGSEWHLRELSPCDAAFDSGLGLIQIDSVQVSVRRGGQAIPYPTLAGTGRLVLDPYPYTFAPGDSVDLKLWDTEAPGIEFAWAYLHGPPRHQYGPFQLDTLNRNWYGTWVINPAPATDENRWVWFEIIDLNDALLNKQGPDRSVLWGVGYIVQ